ncbi:MAG: TraB/GumN family protein [Duncaniella sp.]|nr:TraB/GumN family protein [Duncaniella sp.]
MKKLFISLFTIAIAAIGCNAQLLWKVSGNGIEKPSYIFGTHHIAPISILDDVKGFNEALASVDKVYGELVMSEMTSPEAQQTMITYAMASQDSTLTTILTPAQADSLTAVLRKYMGPMVEAANFDPMKPAMVGTALAMVQSQVAFPNFNPQEQLDTEIQKRAAAAGKEVGGLETMEDQCKALFGSSILEQANDLMDAVRHDDKAIEMAQKLADAYLAGDLQQMLSVIEDPTFGTGDGTERLLNQRNANWVRVMAGLLPTASVLIAVGAGHLPGDKGLISLLRNNGYTVTPVK